MNRIKAIAEADFYGGSSRALELILSGEADVKAVENAFVECINNNRDQVAKNIMAHNPLFDQLSRRE